MRRAGPPVRTPMPRARVWRLAVCLALLQAVPAAAQELIVSAAASLTHAFRDIGAAFEQAHPGARVTFNFAASGPLLQQIANGAPVDAFASADPETMDRAAAQGLVVPASRRDFASNRLVLVQPRGTAALPDLAALAAPAVRRIGLGHPATVPVGRYTRDVLQAEGLWDALSPKFILADSVRQVLDYVARGEVDAGFVYATDAAAGRDRVAVAATLATSRPVLYPIAVVAGSRQPAAADAFARYVGGAAAQAILARHGFGRP